MRLSLTRSLCALLAWAMICGYAASAASEAGCAEAEYLRVIDRQHALAADYVPRYLTRLAHFEVTIFGRSDLQLTYEAASAYTSLVLAARAAGYELLAMSGYRSYYEQRYAFNRWVQFELNRAAEAQETIDEAAAIARANRYSALPGHSEHQLGTAIDVSMRELDGLLTSDLLLTHTGKWLMVHAHSHGFVISYPPGKKHLTGYTAEPWHLRYVGKHVAQNLFDQNYLDPTNNMTLSSYLAQMQWPDCRPVSPPLRGRRNYQ